MPNSSRRSSPYFHHATAFGIAGQIDRPIQYTIPTQGSTSLSPSGGHGAHRVENYSVPGILSFSAAYVTVGGSQDDANDCHATYACSVIEDLNICDMFTADRVVSRITLYHPCDPDPAKAHEANFSIAGSYFENLRIVGRKIDIELTAHPFNNNTYNDFNNGGTKDKKGGEKHREWMIGSHIATELNSKGEIKNEGLRKSLEHNGNVVGEMGKRFLEWDKSRPSNYGGSYRCSAVKHSDLSNRIKDSGLCNFGGVISVPRFGVISLAELVIHKNRRQFTMFRVQMSSPAGGNIDGGGSGGGGGMIPPG